jgi:hypothetical protein
MMITIAVEVNKNIRVNIYTNVLTFQNGGDTGGGTSTGGSKDPLQGGTVSLKTNLTSVVNIPTELSANSVKEVSYN